MKASAQSIAGLYSEPDAWIVGLGTTLALTGLSASPWLLSVLTADAGLTSAQASAVTAVDLLTMAIVMMVASPVVHRLPRLNTIRLALLTIIAAQPVSVWTFGSPYLFVARAASGAGCGLLLAMVTALGAGTASPNRTYAVAGSIGLLAGVPFNPLLGVSVGTGAVFFSSLMAFDVVLSSVIAVLLYRSPTIRHLPVAAKLRVQWTMQVPGVLFLIFLIAGATTAVFVFVAAVAMISGIKAYQLGLLMAVISVISASGGIGATRAVERFGITVPLGLGVTALGAALIAFAFAHTPLLFFCSLLAITTFYWFSLPLALTLAAIIDPAGRVASAGSTTKIVAGAVGSFSGGLIVQHLGYRALGLSALLTCSVALIIGVSTASSLRPRDSSS